MYIVLFEGEREKISHFSQKERKSKKREEIAKLGLNEKKKESWKFYCIWCARLRRVFCIFNFDSVNVSIVIGVN